MSFEEEQKEKRKKKKGFWFWLRRNFYPFLLIFSAFIIVLTITLIMLTKAQWFRYWVSGFIFTTINNELQEGARFEFKDIVFEGSGVWGLALSLKGSSLTFEGDTVFFAKELDAGIKIAPLFRNKIVVNEIVFEGVRINFYRSGKDSLWIIDKIIEPSKDTTATESSEWLIQVRKIRIRDGDLRFYDSTISYTKTEKLDYEHFRLKSVYLNMSVKIDLLKSKYEAGIKELSFYDSYSGNKVKQLELTANLDSRGIIINDLYANLSGSELEGNVELLNFNVFDDADIERARFKININSSKLDIEQISGFIPEEIPVSGIFSFNMSARGKLEHFFTEFEDLSFGNSNLNFTATVKNVTEEDVSVDFDFGNSQLSKITLDSVIKKLEIRGIPDFGDLKIDELKGNFRGDSVFAVFDLNSSLGKAKGEAGVGLRDTLTYSGKVETEELDLSKILLDESMTSNITGNVDFTGSGDRPETLRMGIRMNLNNSRFMDYFFNEIKFNASSRERGRIYIDTLLVGFGDGSGGKGDEDTVRRGRGEKVLFKGEVDIRDMSKVKYDLEGLISNINISEVLENKDLPEQFDARVKVIGEGLDLDSLKTEISFHISEWILDGKSLKPLELEIRFDRDVNRKKRFLLNSNMMNINIEGNFSYLDMIENLMFDIDNMNFYINNKIKDIIPEAHNVDVMMEYNENIRPSKFISEIKEQNFHLTFNLKDSELFKSFIGASKFDCNVDLMLDYNSSDTVNKVKFSNFEIKKFIYEDSGARLQIFPTKIFATATFQYGLSEYQDVRQKGFLLNKFEPTIDINMQSKEGVDFDDLFIFDIITKITYQNENLTLELQSELNEHFKINCEADLIFQKHMVDIGFNKFDFNYSNKISFTAKERIEMSYLNSELEIENFKLLSDKLDLIDLRGKLGENYFKDINLKIFNYNLGDIWNYIPKDEVEFGYELKGNVDSLIIGLNGTFDETDIDLNLDLGKLAVGESYFGNIEANLKHRNSVLSGDVRFYNPYSKTNKAILKLTLGKMPVNMSIDVEGERFYENEPIDISLETSRFPLKILSPFITDVKNLIGFADISLNLSGKNMNKIEYLGFVSFNNTSFLLEANNMNYFSEGKIKFVTDTITVEKISVKNNPTDIANGEAVAKGKIILNNLEPKEFDLKVYSNRFKVLSQASMRTMPSLYGDFVISFGPRPIRLQGRTDAPYLTGDVNILRAALIMPNTSGQEVKQSVLKYEIKSDSTIEFTFVPEERDLALTDKRDVKENTKKESEKSFGDLLDIDVGIRFKGRFVMTMDITGLGQLFAEIGTQNPEDELRFVQKRGAEEPQIYGTDIYVKEGSTLKLIKMLDTKGMVSFTKGVVDNPGLDLVATYKGQRYLEDVVSEYTVNMFIKGTKEKPSISFSYSIDGIEGTGDSSKINEDALLLLTLGKTKEELQSSGSTGGVDYMASASSLASTMASSALTDFVQASNFIQSADIDIGSSLQSLDQARMRFSGDIKGIKWTLGGSVSEFANNNQITIDFPISSVFNVKWLNMILQLSKVTNSPQMTTTKNQKDWEIKLRFGGSW